MATIDFFLEITGLAGGSTEAAEADPSVVDAVENTTIIPITGFQLEVDHLASAGGGTGASKTGLNPLTVHKNVDKSSPLLFSACVSGRQFPTAKLYLQRSADSTYSTVLSYEFKTAIIVKIGWSGSVGSELPTETLTMDYEALSLVYEPTGSVLASDDTPVEAAFRAYLQAEKQAWADFEVDALDLRNPTAIEDLRADTIFRFPSIWWIYGPPPRK